MVIYLEMDSLYGGLIVGILEFDQKKNMFFTESEIPIASAVETKHNSSFPNQYAGEEGTR